MFKCGVCENRNYSSKKALGKHNREVHNLLTEVFYECPDGECKETFSSKRKLQKHYSSCRKKSNSFKCNECGKCSSSSKQLISHQRKHSNFNEDTNEKSKRLQCPLQECENAYNRYSALREHLSHNHNIKLTKESHEFQNETELTNWKSEIEQSARANYVKNTSQKNLKEGHCIYYECHRSLEPRLKKKTIRNFKSVGTNKIGKACPSTLTVTHHADKISVVFYPIHMGHSQELGRLRISEDGRNKIAGKLAEGVTVERVLSDIRNSVRNEEVHRIHLVEKKDINNIIRDYSIGYSTRRHEIDSVSVNLWVQSMKNLDKNPILHFKEVGEEAVLFKKEDFILMIMTEFQQNAFKLFGNRKVCIDGTHGLNQYGFQLFTIVVIDEYGSGVPSAFCFSNRSDVLLFKHFFQCIKNEVGPVAADVFMSDDYPAFYLAWQSIMGDVSKRLLCTWHVNKNWIQNSSKILDKDKRCLALKTLKILQKELNEENFKNQLNTFLNDLKNDPDTLSFYHYFSKTYSNRPNMWAYCCRQYAGINTNMYLESLHKIFKHHYLNGKKCKRLDKTINALMNLVRDKVFERIIKLEKHKQTEKIQKINQSHKRGKDIPKENIILEEHNLWYVTSTEDSDHVYIINRIGENCDNNCQLTCLKCNICLHSFKCSCADNVINHNICKHIHACCQESIDSDLKSSIPPHNIADDVLLNNVTMQLQPDQEKKIDKENLIMSKLEILTGLNTKITLADRDADKVLKKLDDVIHIYNTGEKVNFKVKEKVNTLKNVETQVRMFPVKNKRKNDNTHSSNSLLFESKMIKLALSSPDERVLSIQIATTRGSDHRYLESSAYL